MGKIYFGIGGAILSFFLMVIVMNSIGGLQRTDGQDFTSYYVLLGTIVGTAGGVFLKMKIDGDA